MFTRSVVVKHPHGLHLKTASDFTQLANKYNCEVTIESAGKSVNAKSLLSLLSLGVSRDMEISITAEGRDEVDAVTSLLSLAKNYH